MMTGMKLVAGILSLLFAVCLACTAYKSAGSSPAPTNNASTPNEQAQASPERVACGMKASAAPAILGLKLGMTPDEILNAIPGSKDDPAIQTSVARPANEFGVSGLTVTPAKYQAKDKFPGVSRVTFTLFDGRAYSMTIGYDGPKWPQVDDFVKKVVETSNLPALDQWQDYAGMETQMKILKCSEVEVRVYAGGEGGTLNYVALKDLQAEKKLREREDKAQAKPASSR